MKINIGFLRSIGGIHSWEYYEQNTEVIILGDIEGYRHINHLIDKASGTTSQCQLFSGNLLNNSMEVAFVGAVEIKSNTPIVTTFERPVFINGKMNMELVFIGNKSGYIDLKGVIEKLINKENGDIFDHEHLDNESFDFFSTRGITLNIRWPFRDWSQANLEGLEHLIEGDGANSLPKDINYMAKSPHSYFDVDRQQAQFLLERALKMRQPPNDKDVSV